MVTFEESTDRFTLVMHVVAMGKDLCVSLDGGDVPHIGAVALAVPHAGLRDASKVDASVSVLAKPRHKEDELAKHVAYNLAVYCQTTVSCSCGIHLKDATKEEIAEVLRVADVLIARAKEGVCGRMAQG